MNQLNRKLAPEIESAFVMASAEYSFLSSTGVKELATFGGDIRDLVPAEVAKRAERADRTMRSVPGQRPDWAGACSELQNEPAGRGFFPPIPKL